MKKSISIIIPAFNEDKELNVLLDLIQTRSNRNNIKEVFVVDYNHSSVIKTDRVTVLQSPTKGRAHQLSWGADHATGDILYFLHADSQPPENFDQYIINHFSDEVQAGCFRMNFDDPHPMLKFFAWFTQFNYNFCRGGDQSLFVGRDCYHKVGGFDTSLMLMEDIEIIKKIQNVTGFLVINNPLITSARKYHENGIYNLQWRFFVLHIQHSLGYSQNNMVEYYKRNIV